MKTEYYTYYAAWPYLISGVSSKGFYQHEKCWWPQVYISGLPKLAPARRFQFTECYTRSFQFLLKAVSFIAGNKKIMLLWMTVTYDHEYWLLYVTISCNKLFLYNHISTVQCCSVAFQMLYTEGMYYQMLQFDTVHSSIAYSSHLFPLCGMQCLPNIDFLTSHQCKWHTGTQPSRKSIIQAGTVQRTQ
jgi:hypothetical protein